jgi:aminoglycoside phosphotransferase family enzyme/predicted kinase
MITINKNEGRAMGSVTTNTTAQNNGTSPMTHASLTTALLDKNAYDHAVDNITLRETHISWVFLTGEYAYKVKKPVDFGFLDFSTLEKRKYFCEEEVRVNGRLAPDLYLAVVPVCGDITSARINGDGPIIEYAVKMRQFDTQQEFDELLARHELTEAHIDETARVLAEFHKKISVADESAAYGTPEAIQHPVLENFEQIHQLGDKWLSQNNLKEPLIKLHQWSVSQYQQLETTLKNRKQNGFVRECHGDLHLRNIVLYNNKVTPFDGIEFNPNLRWIDVMSELAFLLMDIDDHNRPDLSRRLLNDYLGITGDYDGLTVLRFYQVYRAMVRAKVAGLQLLQHGTTRSNENDTLVQEIVNYIQLAIRYTQTSIPKLIITHGLSGSGKTYLSQKLLEQYDIIRLRSDVERKRLFDMEEKARDMVGIDKGIYTREASEKTYQHLLKISNRIINAGYSVIVDAAFLRQEQRQLFLDFCNKSGIPIQILHCEAKMNVQRQRLRTRQTQDLDASDASETILNRQLNNHDPLTTVEKSFTTTIDTTERVDISGVVKWLET